MGQPSHGFRHSVECKRRLAQWLAEQEAPTAAEEVPVVSADHPEVRRRLRGKRSPGEPGEEEARGARDLPADPRPSGQKRPAEVPAEAIEEDRSDPTASSSTEPMNLLLESLALEAMLALAEEEDEDPMVSLGGGGMEWCPQSWVRAGDLKEMQGLIDREVFEICEEAGGLSGNIVPYGEAD